MNVIKANEVNVLSLGRQGEDLRTKIEFDYSDLIKEFPGGAAVLRVRLPVTDANYNEASVEYDFDNNKLFWTVTAHDTAYEGTGACQLIYTWEGMAKSKIWKTNIGGNIVNEEETPPAWTDWMDELTKLGALAIANAERAYHYAQDAEGSAEDASGYAEDAGKSATDAAASANFVKKAELSIIQKHAEVVTMHREVQSNKDATDANREQATAAAESASESAEVAVDAMERSSAIATSVGQLGFVTEQNAQKAQQYANSAESAKNTAVQAAQTVGQIQAQINQTADAVNANKIAVEGFKNEAEGFATQAGQYAGQADEVRRKYETMNVVAQTRDAGSPPDVTYIPETNTTIYGIPKGDKGDPGDPSVTKETIHNALGYDPADEAEVSQIKGDMSDLPTFETGEEWANKEELSTELLLQALGEIDRMFSTGLPQESTMGRAIMELTKGNGLLNDLYIGMEVS